MCRAPFFMHIVVLEVMRMSSGRKLKNGLTATQERYCRERAKGKTQREAYVASHPDNTASRKSQDEQACRMERNELLRKRIEALQEQVDAGLILDLEQIQATISSMVTDEERPDAIRLKAADQLTRMRGGYRDNVQISADVSYGGRLDRALGDFGLAGADGDK